MLRYVVAAFRYLGRSDVPRLKILAVKLSRRVKLNVLLRSYFTGLDRASWRLLTRDRGVKIGVISRGIMGDKIILMALLNGVRRAFPGAKILLFDKDIDVKYAAVYRDQPVLDGIYPADGYLVNDLARMALGRGLIDVLIDNRYAVKVEYAPNSRADRAPLAGADAAFARHDVNFADYPRRSDLLSAAFPQSSNFEIMSHSSTLAVDPDTITLPLREADFGPRRTLGNVRYVTIHHGAGARADGLASGQTKMWFAERWARVVEDLARRGYLVLQLGLAGEEVIPGADARFLGVTSLFESAALIKDATLHLDTEGGLVHVSHAVRTRAVVLFGPTPPKFFGYARNFNVQRGGCVDCWWSKDDWQTRCPRGLPVPACMDAVGVEDVLAAVDQLLAEVARA